MQKDAFPSLASLFKSSDWMTATSEGWRLSTVACGREHHGSTYGFLFVLDTYRQWALYSVLLQLRLFVFLLWSKGPHSTNTYEPAHDKTKQMTCAPSEDSDQPGHPPSLIRVFIVRSMGNSGPKLSPCGQRRLWLDWADALADLSLRWVHMPFCRFCHALAHIFNFALHLNCWQSFDRVKLD